MKKLKKVLIVIFAVMVVASSFGISAAAAPAKKQEAPAIECVCDVNSITAFIAQKVADAANAQIAALVEQAQNSRHPNIDKLVKQTNAISAAAVDVINFLGYDAECQFVE